MLAETAPTSTAAIRAALEPLAADEIYLLGTFTAPESREALPTVSVSGDRVTLLYAEPAVLQAWDERVLTAVSLTVQARHAPDTSPGALGPLGAPIPVIDPRLQRWLP